MEESSKKEKALETTERLGITRSSSKETAQEIIRRLGLKPSSARHPQTRSEVIVFLGSRVGPGMVKEYREAKERAEKDEMEESKANEPKPTEDQQS